MPPFLRFCAVLLLLLPLAGTTGCISSKAVEDFLDSRDASWKLEEDKVAGPGGTTLKDARAEVKAKADGGASFIYVPLELGDGGWVQGTFRFHDPETTSNTALAGLQVLPMGPGTSAFLLVQPNVIAGVLVLNVFAQVGPTLVGQLVLQDEDLVVLKIQRVADNLMFEVNEQPLGQAALPDTQVDWVLGYGISGLAKKQRVSLEAVRFNAGAAPAGLTEVQIAKRSVFAVATVLLGLVFDNDGQVQALPDLETQLALAGIALDQAFQDALDLLPPGKLQKKVLKDMGRAEDRLIKLIKEVAKKKAQGKTLSQTKVRDSAAKALKEVLKAAARLGEPPAW